MLPHGPTLGPTDPVRVARPWFETWVDAAYGERGFWTRERPSDHFATTASTGTWVARGLARLVKSQAFAVVVDVGAGDGDLLDALAPLVPGVRLLGVDRRPRPAGLDAGVRWYRDHYDVRTGRWGAGPEVWLDAAAGPALLMAHEWLDDLPARVVVRTAEGWREVFVDASGKESVGPPPDSADRGWLDRWWPASDAVEGERAEIGRTRDTAWAGLVRVARSTDGTALAVDYGHRVGERPTRGSLAAYARGRQVAPRPDGSVNLTAHVAMDALVAAGVGAGAGADGSSLLRQRDQLPGLLDPPAPPARSPVGVLAALEQQTQWSALRADPVWGRLWWLFQGPGPRP